MKYRYEGKFAKVTVVLPARAVVLERGGTVDDVTGDEAERLEALPGWSKVSAPKKKTTKKGDS